MAFAPKPHPPVPTMTDEERAAAALERDVHAAKVLERHVDLYLAAQRLAPGASAEVSIGEHGKVTEGARRELEQLYRAAGWTTVKTTDDPADPRGILLHLAP